MKISTNDNNSFLPALVITLDLVFEYMLINKQYQEFLKEKWYYEQYVPYHEERELEINYLIH